MSRWFYVNRCKMAYSQLFQQIKGVTASALSVVPSQMLYVCVRQWEKGTELHLLRERNMWMAVWLVNGCVTCECMHDWERESRNEVWTVVMNEIDEVWERKKNDKTVLLYLLQNLTQNISKIYFILQNILIFIKKIKLKFV